MKNIKLNPLLCSVSGLFFALLLASGCSIMPPNAATELPVIPFPAPPSEPRFYYEQTIVSSLDVVREDKDRRIQRWLTSGVQAGVGLSKPFDIAVHHGRIFVSDSVAKAVFVFDKPAGRFFRVGVSELKQGRLISPMGLDVDGEGNLYVIDISQQAVLIYDRDGIFQRSMNTEGLLDRAANLTVSPDGARLFLVDTGGVRSKNHRIRMFDAKSGEHLRDFGTRGQENGQFNFPRDVAVGPNGMLHIVDSANFRIQVIDPDTGAFIRSFGAPGRSGGQFSRPKSIDVDSQGNIYVSDAAFGNFQIFNAQGRLLLAVGSRSDSFSAAHFGLPSGLAVDEDGRVYMMDEYFRKIDVFRPANLGKNEGYFAMKPALDRAEQSD